MIGNNAESISNTVQCKVGLVNYAGKYLTAETFGFKVNASGGSMRKKQLWSLEQGEEEEVVYLKSHLGRYLTTDKQGAISCDMEDRSEGGQFGLVYHTDGRWAFQSKLNKCYLGATEDSISCREMTATDVQYWYIRLALHPQINLYNVNRKRYVHLHKGNGKLQCDELIPWGPDALITIEYIKGKYAFRSSDNRLLTKSGDLVSIDQAADKNTLFTLEIHSEGMAFKDVEGKYLTAIGRDATLQSKNSKVTKDEMFILQDSHIQVCLTAHNGKKVSARQGIDLTAKQEDITDTETFQLELDQKTNQWRLKSCANKLWSVAASGGVQINGFIDSPDSLFSIEWYDNGQVALKSTSGKYVTARPNGSLFAASESVTDQERYTLTILNRPGFVIRCDYGFVGFKCTGNPRIECNKASHEPVILEHDSGKNGEYYFKGSNGKYWDVDNEGMINAVSEQPKAFLIQITGQSRCAVKAPNGSFIKAEQNGIMSAKVIDVAQATCWEF